MNPDEIVFVADRRTFKPRTIRRKARLAGDRRIFRAHPFRVPAIGFTGSYPGQCGDCPFSVNDPIHAADR